MINRTELLVNIVRRAPWLLAGNEAFFPEKVNIETEYLWAHINNSPVTIIYDNGFVCREQISVSIKNNEMKISKPVDREKVSDTFHLFFQSRDQNWFFFLVENAVSYPMSFSVKTPDTIYSLQKRRHPRVMTPGNMGVMFRSADNTLNNAHVQNISVGGMLICENSAPERYRIYSLISDMFISISMHNRREANPSSRNIWPLISKGRIVRTSFDKESTLSYYGIMFLHESSYVKETLSLLIDGFSC